MKLRIKDYTQKVGSGVTPRGGAETYLDHGIPLFRSQNVLNGGFLMEDIAYISEDVDEAMKGTRVKPGDVLLNITGASIGRCYYTSNDFLRGNVNQHVCIIRPKRRIANPAYLHYCLISDQGQEQIDLTQTGVNREGLTIEEIKNFSFDIPSKEEQQRIVDYLDAKLSAIDKRMAVLEKQQDAYARLKKSMIHQAVTRGLNPNVRLKDSGIEWLGMIPEHWEELHLKNCVAINNGCDYKAIEVDDGYPVIGSGGVFAYASEKMYEGEVLFLGRKGTIDKPMYYNGSFWSVDTMFFAIPKKNAICKYLYYCATQFPFVKISTATALPSMTQKELYQLPIMLPPLAEQCAIAAYLDEKCTKIDAAIENIGKQIEASKRLKRAVINEAISGKTTI